MSDSTGPETVDLLVVGGGLAGSVAALSAARAHPDATVELLVTADDRFDHHPGTVDVLGYPSPAVLEESSDGARTAVETPLDSLDLLAADHPYRRLGRDTVETALALFDDALDYRGTGSEQNALVVTATGRVRPTARYPPGMAAGLASLDEPMRLVGFEQIPDLDAALAAERLDERLPYDVAGATVDFPGTVTDYPAGPVLATALDENDPPSGDVGTPALDPEEGLPPELTDTDETGPAREQLTERVLPELGVEGRVGFPAVLGETDHAAVRKRLEAAFHADVFEVPVGPPSVPGRRLERRLHDALADAGVAVTRAEVEGFDAGGRLERVTLTDGARSPRSVVLATGGLAGPGLVADRTGVHESTFDCHVDQPSDRTDWTAPEFLGDHELVRFGVTVDDELRPLDADGRPAYDNLRAAGTVLAGFDYEAEQSRDGVALATGYAAGRRSLPPG